MGNFASSRAQYLPALLSIAGNCEVERSDEIEVLGSSRIECALCALAIIYVPRSMLNPSGYILYSPSLALVPKVSRVQKYAPPYLGSCRHHAFESVVVLNNMGKSLEAQIDLIKLDFEWLASGGFRDSDHPTRIAGVRVWNSKRKTYLCPALPSGTATAKPMEDKGIEPLTFSIS